MIGAFLLGVTAALSIVAGVFFLRFWRETRDFFFLAFAAFFFFEAGTRCALLFFQRPNEGSPWIYLIRLLALVMILVAILNKNYGRSN
ncbi:MAG TPA: DUF5985 family protein [Terriglobales bacterium]|nr:DUF5985 family protein [Terriglobales bacterium]